MVLYDDMLLVLVLLLLLMLFVLLLVLWEMCLGLCAPLGLFGSIGSDSRSASQHSRKLLPLLVSSSFPMSAVLLLLLVLRVPDSNRDELSSKLLEMFLLLLLLRLNYMLLSVSATTRCRVMGGRNRTYTRPHFSSGELAFPAVVVTLLALPLPLLLALLVLLWVASAFPPTVIVPVLSPVPLLCEWWL